MASFLVSADAQRSAKFYAVLYARWEPSPDAETYKKRREACKSWVRDTKNALQPFGVGAYGQLAGNASAYKVAHAGDDDWAHEYVIPGQPGLGWASNLPRLRTAKAKYDPKSLFVNTDRIEPGEAWRV